MRIHHLLAAAILLVAAPVTSLVAADSVVHFSKLTPLLVDVPGWESEKADGNTLDAGQMKMTSVSRRYSKGDSSVEVTIIDYNLAQDTLAGLTAVWGFSNESTEGYQKGVNVDGMKGFENYQNADKNGELFLLVANRFMVSIKVSGLPASELQAWAKRIELKKLEQMK